MQTKISSQGQFSIVVEEELPEMKKAFATFDTPTAKYNPKLTIVICEPYITVTSAFLRSDLFE